MSLCSLLHRCNGLQLIIIVRASFPEEFTDQVKVVFPVLLDGMTVWRSPVHVHSAASQVRRVECSGARRWLVLLE